MGEPMNELLESAKLAGLFFVLPLGAAAALAAIGDRLLDRRWHRNHTPDVIPHDLEDFREPVAPYFNGRIEHDARTAYAIHKTVFENNEDRIGPGPLTTSKELTHARSTLK